MVHLILGNPKSARHPWFAENLGLQLYVRLWKVLRRPCRGMCKPMAVVASTFMNENVLWIMLA